MHWSGAPGVPALADAPTDRRFRASCRAVRSPPRGPLRSVWAKAGSGAWTSIGRSTGCGCPAPPCPRSRRGVAPTLCGCVRSRRSATAPPRPSTGSRSVVAGSRDRGGGPRRPARPAAVAWVRGHRADAATTAVVVRGLRVVSPVDTWLQLGAELGLRELVMIGDALVRRRQPLAVMGDLVEAVSRHRADGGTVRSSRHSRCATRHGFTGRDGVAARSRRVRPARADRQPRHPRCIRPSDRHRRPGLPPLPGTRGVRRRAPP